MVTNPIQSLTYQQTITEEVLQLTTKWPPASLPSLKSLFRGGPPQHHINHSSYKPPTSHPKQIQHTIAIWDSFQEQHQDHYHSTVQHIRH